MNRMQALAKVFGKKIGEEFYVKGYTNKIIKVRFTDKSCEFYNEDRELWLSSQAILVWLLDGSLEIVEEWGNE